MPRSRIPSPARSQGAAITPRRERVRRTRSVASPSLSIASGRLTSVIDQFEEKNMDSFALSPMNTRRSVLTDNTDIEEPRRRSWWKKLDDNSRNKIEVLENNERVDDNNAAIEELLDIEQLSQEKKNFTLDLPESSDSESVNSIEFPQRKLFSQKENQTKKNSYPVMVRDTLAKSKTNITNHDITTKASTKQLFQVTKRTKPVFPEALLHITANETVADTNHANTAKAGTKQLFQVTKRTKAVFPEALLNVTSNETAADTNHENTTKASTKQLFQVTKRTKSAFPAALLNTTANETAADTNHDNTTKASTKQLFQASKRTKPVFPAALINIAANETAPDKTKELVVESEAQNRNLFGNRPANKRKNMFANFIMSDSEEEIPEIQPKVSSFQKRDDRGLVAHASNIITDIEMEDWKHLPSSTMVEHQLEEMMTGTPVKRARLGSRDKEINKTKRNVSVENVDDYERNIQKIQKSLSKKVEDEHDDATKNRVTSKEKNDNNIDEKEKAEDEIDANINEENGLQNQDDFNSSNVNDKEKIETSAKHHRKSILISQENRNKDVNDGPESEIESQDVVEAKTLNKTQEDSSGNDTCCGIENEQNEEEIDDQQVPENDDVEQETENDEQESDEIEYETENDKQEDDDVEQEIENDDQEDDDIDQETENNEQENGAVEQETENEGIENDETEQETENEGLENDETKQETENDEIENETEDAQHENDDLQQKSEKQYAGQVLANTSRVKDHNQENELSGEVEDDNIEGNNNETEIENDTINKSKEAVVDESEEIDNDTTANDSQIENDAEEPDQSEEDENEQELNDSDDAERAIASDDAEQDDEQIEEMEVDEEDSPELKYDSDTEEKEQEENTEQNEASVEHNESKEEIEESPNTTHDTTGRNRKKLLDRSPEEILSEKTNQGHSFTVHGRNTSVRKTKSMGKKSLNIKPSMAPLRESTGMSDGTGNSSAEGSGWDSHRTTRKTIRQTFGKDYTTRKSLRALVMEKSAKRQTEHLEHLDTMVSPQANSTEFPNESNRDVEDEEIVGESDHEASLRTRQTTLELYLQKIKQQNMERRLRIEQQMRNSIKPPPRDILNFFKVPDKPAPKRPKPTQNKPNKNQIKSIIPLAYLPPEIVEDMKYKPPKRFQPANAPWITKRLYKFLETKLEPKYDYRARVRAEKLVEMIYQFAKDIRRLNVAPADRIDALKLEMARLDIVNTHFEFYEFFHEYMPREVRVKVVPDIVNKIGMPRCGVFANILPENARG